MDKPRKIEALLSQVQEGMAVYDADQQKIGHVTDIHFGADADEQALYGAGSATDSEQDTSAEVSGQNLMVPLPLASAGGGIGGNTGWVGAMPGVTFEDEIPEPLRARLIRSGFIKIKAMSIMGTGRYITPDQIASIQDQKVYLNVMRDGIIRDDPQA